MEVQLGLEFISARAWTLGGYGASSSPRRKIQPNCDHTRATRKEGRGGGAGRWGERGPLIPPLCKGQRLVETWGSGCCRSEVQGSGAKWREEEREWGKGMGTLASQGRGAMLPC